MAETIFDIRDARINEDYIALQVESAKESAYWNAHKARIGKFDKVYGGNLLGLTVEENSLENEPYVENKLKNAAHDIKRLAREAHGVPVFTKEGEDDKSERRSKIRAAVTDTIWQEGGGADVEGMFYLDLIRGGFTAVAAYTNNTSEYPLAMRCDPQFSYPTVTNGRLQDFLYLQTVKERQAALLFPDAGLSKSAASTDNVDVIMFFDRDKVIQAIVSKKDKKTTAKIVDTWVHKLGVVPVAFRALETADGHFRGLLDQLSGPLRARNKATRLMIDYLEDMAHAPYEEKGIENSSTPPGPTTVYHHERDAEGETFIRRVQPAAPAAAVFGLLNYLDTQEQNEGFQPPARVGTVKQSIASGSFVEATQGSLSSVVLELQGYVAELRRDWNKVALKIDETHLDREKPLVRAVGQKQTYTPKKDIKGWYYHKIAFGAAAGLDRTSADSRVLQHLGAGLIDEGIARSQIDYIEEDTNVQDDVDRMLLRKVMFQKLIQDPAVPFSALAQLEQEMGNGKSRFEALKAVLPQILAREEQQLAAEAGPAGPAQGAPDEQVQGATEAGLELPPQGGVPQGQGQRAADAELADFAPPPFTQISG